MPLKDLFQKAKELAMPHEARVREAFQKAVPAELHGLLLAGGPGEAERIADSLAQLTAQDVRQGSVQEIADLLSVYVIVVKSYLLDGRRLHDVRADLLRKYESFLKAENIGPVTAFCVLHAGDNTFFMTSEDAQSQLAAMEESLAD